MNQSTIILTCLIIAAAITSTHGLLGFDCGGHLLNITTVSLLGAGECDLQIKTPAKEDVYIQLLQLSEYNIAEVMHCKIEMHRTIFHCGMHSHISAVKNGEVSFMEEVPYERCKRLHNDGVIEFGFTPDSTVTGLKVNQTSYRAITLAGSVTESGQCKGAKYNDPYGDWDDVVVQASVKIELRTSFAHVHLGRGDIILQSGTVCPLKNGYCLDSDHGYSYWKPLPVGSCDFHQYDILYQGQATKMKDLTQNHQPTVYSLVTNTITFALTAHQNRSICGYKVYPTEHPKLFILETTKDNVPKTQENIAVDNLDIFTYVNSKFVYVEKHIRNQMTTLYHNVIQQRCELEAEVLRNTLSFATLLPDEFAYRLMKGPGYMAVTAGEAIHVVKCIPIDVLARKSDECYQELPVQVRNVSFFLTPKSRILTKTGTQRDCIHWLPTLYRIEDIWVQFLPEPQIFPVPPQQLQPMTKLSWKYLTPGPLADSGIYTDQDINRLREHIMFPAEKPALLNSIARGVSGYSTGVNRLQLHNLLDEEALEKIAHSTAAKLWGGFVTFGSATAGVLGIFIIIRVIKIIIDTAIHGYALHTAYGCSLHLLGAIWSSLTHLLLHLAHPPSNKKKEKKTKTSTDEEDEKPPKDDDDNDPPPPITRKVRFIQPETVNITPQTSQRHSVEYLALNQKLDEISKLNY